MNRPAAGAARRVFIRVAVREIGYSGAAVVRHLGAVASTVSRAAQQNMPPLVERLAWEIKGGIS